jgi:hypothetical protein
MLMLVMVMGKNSAQEVNIGFVRTQTTSGWIKVSGIMTLQFYRVNGLENQAFCMYIVGTEYIGGSYSGLFVILLFCTYNALNCIRDSERDGWEIVVLGQRWKEIGEKR